LKYKICHRGELGAIMSNYGWRAYSRRVSLIRFIFSLSEAIYIQSSKVLIKFGLGANSFNPCYARVLVYPLDNNVM